MDGHAACRDYVGSGRVDGQGRRQSGWSVEGAKREAMVFQWQVADTEASLPSTQFSQTFPRKFFTDEEKSKTLKELGLVPNAALEASPA